MRSAVIATFIVAATFATAASAGLPGTRHAVQSMHDRHAERHHKVTAQALTGETVQDAHPRVHIETRTLRGGRAAR